MVLERAPEVVEVHRLQTDRDISAGLHTWQAVVHAGAYSDVAKDVAGKLLRGLTPELAEELVYCLERLHEATTTALVVVRAELRDELAPSQLQLELGGGER